MCLARLNDPSARRLIGSSDTTIVPQPPLRPPAMFTLCAHIRSSPCRLILYVQYPRELVVLLFFFDALLTPALGRERK